MEAYQAGVFQSGPGSRRRVPGIRAAPRIGGGAAIRGEVPGAWFVWTRAKQEIDLKASRYVSEHLQTSTFRQAVLEHGDHALTHPTDLAQAALGHEPKQPDAAKIDSEMQDDVLDRDRLLTKVVRHAPVNQEAIIRRSLRPYAAPWSTGRDHPRAMVTGIDSPRPSTNWAVRDAASHDGAAGSREGTGYNRGLTGRRLRPAHSRLPGQEEPIA